MQIPSLEAGRIYPWMTSALKDLQYKIREVNMFIEVCLHLFVCWLLFTFIFGSPCLKFELFLCFFCQCIESVSSVCTLYELGRSLAGLKDKKHYEELNLGPLCKLPRIHRLFKIDSNTRDDDIQQIETVDILKVSHAFTDFIRYSLKKKRENDKNMNVTHMKLLFHISIVVDCV